MADITEDWAGFDQLNDGVVDPPSNCCYLYVKDDFGGSDTRTFCHFGKERVISLRKDAYDFDNSLSSWYCGADTIVHFCAMDFGEEGECVEDRWNAKLSSAAGNIQNERIGGALHNGVSSLRLVPYDVVAAGAVTLFDENDCTGQSSMFQSNGGEFTYYSGDYFDQVGIQQDRAASVMIPEGYQVTLFKDD